MKRTNTPRPQGLDSAIGVVSVSELEAASLAPKLTSSQTPTRVRRLGGPLISAAVVAGALVAAGALAALPPDPPVAAAPPPVRVVVRPATAEAGFDVDRALIGVVRSAQRSVLGFPRSERVIEIATDEGHTVEEGEVIARLDTALLDAERQLLEARLRSARARLDELIEGPRAEDIAQARAEATRAKADLDLSVATLGRLEMSLAKDAISEQRYDEGRLARDAAIAVHDAARAQLERLENGTRSERIEAQRAEVASIEAELTRNRVALEDSRLTAPFAGRVAVRHVDVGTVVAAGQPVVELLEQDRPEIRVGLPVGVELEAGAKYDVTTPTGRAKATFVRTLPERSLASRTTEALLQLSSPDVTVRNGDAVTVHLRESRNAEGFWVPLEALTQSVRGMWSVSVVKLDGATSTVGVVERRELRLDHTEGERGFVSGALRDGELLIVGGAHRAVPGQRVEVGAQP